MESEMIERVANAIMKVDFDEKTSDYYKWAIAAIEALTTDDLLKELDRRLHTPPGGT